MNALKKLIWFTVLPLLIGACSPLASPPLAGQPTYIQPAPTQTLLQATRTEPFPTKTPILATAPSTSTPASTAPPTVNPSPAQVTGNRYTFEGISFILDPAVASGVQGQVIPEKPLTQDGPYWEVNPRFVKMSLDGYPLQKTFFQPVIAIYPVEDYRKLDTRSAETLDKLKNLLSQKPADADKFPFLPPVNAGQVFHSNVQYLTFQNGSGVRYLAIYAQYVAPVNNQDLFYTFQGLTADGRYFVSIILPVNHPTLPRDLNAVSQSGMDAILNNPSYYKEMSAALTAQPAGSFTPDLSKLDALVNSLIIERTNESN